MKPFKNILILYRSGKFRNFSIIMGVLMSVFLLNSFNAGDSVNAVSDVQTEELKQKASTEINSITVSNRQQERYSAKYHNFLASYFLQESSVERSKKKSEEKSSFFSNLKDIHHVIFRRQWSPL